MNKPGN